METMSKLEQELIQRLATLSKCKMVIEEGEIIAQLRDELAKCQEEKRLASVAATEEAAIADKALKRAERAEKDLEKQIVINQTCHGLVRGNPCKDYGELSSATVNDVADLVQTLQRVIKERDEALAKLQHASDAKPVGYISPDFIKQNYMTGYISNAAYEKCSIPVYLAPPEQPGDVLFDGLRYVTSTRFDLDKALLAEQTSIATIPVNVTIRKAGE